MLFSALMVLLAIAGVIYFFLISNYGYWRKRGVDGPKPLPFFGNFIGAFTQKRHMVYDLDEAYRAFKHTAYFVGIFSSRCPQLLITNPDLMRRIYVNDFKHFHDNDASSMVDEKSDFIFANNPFSLTGETWKERRAELTPGMTATRVKASFPVTQKVCAKLTDHIRTQMKMGPKNGLDAKDICLRFTSEVVTDCVLGLEAESFAENPTPIMTMIKKLFDQTGFLVVYFILVGLLPDLKRFYKSRFIQKSVEKFFVELMETAINIRKKQPRDRMDFLNYMLQLQEKKHLDTKHLTAHTMTFFLDGFETTATVLSHCLLLLGRNKETQKRLRDEIKEHFGQNKQLEFDKLNDLPYLDACIHEAIRIFPPGFFTSKICTEPIEFTNKNGTKLKLRKGEVVILPLYSVMTDEEYYPHPQEFRPERFLEEDGGVKTYREKGVYFGFGDGPRVCLGMRFALAQAKAGLAEIIQSFSIEVNPKTRTDNLLDKMYFISRLEGGIWLNFIPL